MERSSEVGMLPPYKDGKVFINPNVTTGAPAEQGARP